MARFWSLESLHMGTSEYPLFFFYGVEWGGCARWGAWLCSRRVTRGSQWWRRWSKCWEVGALRSILKFPAAHPRRAALTTKTVWTGWFAEEQWAVINPKIAAIFHLELNELRCLGVPSSCAIPARTNQQAALILQRKCIRDHCDDAGVVFVVDL